MKKILVVAALFVSMAAANAQQFGVLGGLTLSQFGGTEESATNKNMTLYHAGLVYKADLGAGFAIQPVLSYSVKGANVERSSDVLNKTIKSKTGFAELSLGLQWGPDLMAFRPYLFVEPFIGYSVVGKSENFSLGGSTSSDKINVALAEAKNKLEYGVGAGLGLEITRHIQLSCQLFRNFGKLYPVDKLDTGELREIKPSYENLKNYQGIKVSLAILF